MLLSSFLVLVATCLIFVRWTYGHLHHIPGPLIAKFTDLWRLLVVRRRDSHDTYLRLHKRYGDLVRIGPNNVSICKPDLIPIIYGIGKGYLKSDFYAPWQNVVNGKRTPSLVFTTDEALHATMRRPVASAFALSTLVEFEPLIDSTTAVFLSRLDELYAGTSKSCNLGQWLQWYAFDVIGELTFSKRLGFMEKAEDVEGIIASVSANFDRCSVLGQMPWIDLITYKNPLYQQLFATPVSNPIVDFGKRRLEERLAGNDDEAVNVHFADPALEGKVRHGKIPSKPDFLSRFLTLHEEQPDVVTDRQILAYLFANLNAGSDTIGSTLKAVFYYLLKVPDTMDELVNELKAAEAAGRISLPLPTWPECQKLPCLNATIKEALRLNPALALPFERVVPPGSGLKIGDVTIPSGTIVGINPWVLHRDTRIFGDDAEQWRPGRWISNDAEKIKYMDHHILSFGGGKRSCLGKNIAMLELTKLVPALLLRYNLQLANPNKEWQVFNSWVVRQEGLDVLMSRRQ
ncbi:Hypothetical protein R9X50_00377300 [Acrodontium crateriforme]|uniref:Cytochrome P450 n=1 Tax=Acrodontium crateriforme TaxID=150365 RepID=A0AAQ3M424_9PEZI|nr:Hypothetical protein R9X50_00377300 [Acrodontium crateriforme]